MTLEGALAVTRFGLGAISGEIETASRAPKTWLLAQLTATPAHPAFDKLKSSAEAYGMSRAYRDERKVLMGAEKAEASKRYAQNIRRNFQAETKARAIHAAHTQASFHERLSRFWSNHFNVSARSRNTRLLAGAYEREAIRPHILGNFFDLAKAAVFHPGMLVYLDNIGSTGPGSRAGRNRGRGLNENLAREVLELHTVTPTANYGQTDVTEFAKALTGWTIGRNENRQRTFGKTDFSPRTHEPGTRTVLGHRYSEQGQNQALQILRDMCLRPETAHNIATKLARHFVSDAPPKALVKALEINFLETQGDLVALYKTLIDSPHAWYAEAQKVKSPEELLTSTARMIGIENVFPRRANDSYDSLGQPPFGAPTPEGWPDIAEAWIGPNAVIKRIEWANELSARLQSLDARDFLRSALGARATKTTLEAVSRAESGKQALALALMSPEFQRR